MSLEQLTEVNWRGRQQGKTKAMAGACARIGAILICHNQEEAQRVVREYGIKAISQSVDIIGTTGPYLVDPHLVGEYAYEMRRSLQEKNEEIKRITEAFDKREEDIAKYNLLLKLIRTAENSGKLGVDHDFR